MRDVCLDLPEDLMNVRVNEFGSHLKTAWTWKIVPLRTSYIHHHEHVKLFLLTWPHVVPSSFVLVPFFSAKGPWCLVSWTSFWLMRSLFVIYRLKLNHWKRYFVIIEACQLNCEHKSIFCLCLRFSLHHFVHIAAWSVFLDNFAQDPNLIRQKRYSITLK